MKNFYTHLFILFLIGTSKITYSQAPLWPTENAKWYYYKFIYTADIYVHYSIDRDTIIQNKNCQIYKRYEKMTQYMSNSESESTDYSARILSIEDSVLYRYNKITSEFDTIVNFKANIGDSWRGYLNSYYADSNEFVNPSFQVTVTNITSETMNGLNLNVYELTYSKEDIQYPLVYKFYQYIGGLNGIEIDDFDNSDFVEAFGTSTNCIVLNEGETDEFLYHGGFYDAEKGCDYVPFLGIAEEKMHEFEVVNPMKDNQLVIYTAFSDQIESIELYNNLGQVIPIEFEKDENRLIGTIVNEPMSGFYFLNILLSSGNSVIKKVILE
ncbi:MAG TPA: T9SS type A sorting domain-containing protein [Taishania sp.]|nr:T9SS type A sorting domain-containing protein [Taishania sp.]